MKTHKAPAGKATESPVIEVLNKARSAELAAITQYMAQHYGLDDADYGQVAAQLKLIAIDEMRHAELFAERVYELHGLPATEPDLKAVKGQHRAACRAVSGALRPRRTGPGPRGTVWRGTVAGGS